MLTLRHVSLLVFFAISTVLLNGCIGTHISIENKASLPITSVTIKLSGNKYRIDSILPGQTATQRLYPSGEPGIKLEYYYGGRKIVAKVNKYIDSLLSRNINITIKEEGQFTWTVLEDPEPKTRALYPLNAHPPSVRLSLSIDTDQSSRVTALSTNRHHAQLAYCNSDGFLNIWSLRHGRQVETIEAHNDLASSLTYASDGSLLITAGYDQSIKLWDVPTFKLRRAVPVQAVISSISLNVANTVLATSGSTGKIMLWNVLDGSQIRVLQAGKDWALHTIYNSARGLIVATSSDNTVHVWRADNYTLLKVLHVPEGPSSIAMSATGHFLAVGTQKGSIYIYDTADFNKYYLPKGHSASIETLSFAPHQHLLVSGGQDQKILIWNVEKRELAGSFGRAPGPIIATTWVSDPALLVVSIAGDSNNPNSVNELRFYAFQSRKYLMSLLPLSPTEWLLVSRDGLIELSPFAHLFTSFKVDGADFPLSDVKRTIAKSNLFSYVLKSERTMVHAR